MDTPTALRQAWEAQDAAAFAACFTSDGEFHSPVISGAVGIRGRHAIAELMKVAFASTSDTAFIGELGESDVRALRLDTKFRGTPAQGVIWMDLEPDGQIRELWVFVRPLTSVVAVSAALGPGLARRESGLLGLGARLGLKPLVVLASMVDRVGQLLIRRLNREKP